LLLIWAFLLQVLVCSSRLWSQGQLPAAPIFAADSAGQHQSAEHSLQLRQQESWQERQSFDATLRCRHEDCTSQVAGGSAAAAWGSSNKQQYCQQ